MYCQVLVSSRMYIEMHIVMLSVNIQMLIEVLKLMKFFCWIQSQWNVTNKQLYIISSIILVYVKIYENMILCLLEEVNKMRQTTQK